MSLYCSRMSNLSCMLHWMQPKEASRTQQESGRSIDSWWNFKRLSASSEQVFHLWKLFFALCSSDCMAFTFTVVFCCVAKHAAKVSPTSLESAAALTQMKTTQERKGIGCGGFVPQHKKKHKGVTFPRSTVVWSPLSTADLHEIWCISRRVKLLTSVLFVWTTFLLKDCCLFL